MPSKWNFCLFRFTVWPQMWRYERYGKDSELSWIAAKCAVLECYHYTGYGLIRHVRILRSSCSNVSKCSAWPTVDAVGHDHDASNMLWFALTKHWTNSCKREPYLYTFWRYMIQCNTTCNFCHSSRIQLLCAAGINYEVSTLSSLRLCVVVWDGEAINVKSWDPYHCILTIKAKGGLRASRSGSRCKTCRTTTRTEVRSALLFVITCRHFVPTP